jgi:hypothetical protein
MHFVVISEQTAIISLYNINWLAFIPESDFGGLMVTMLVSGTQDRGFEPGQSEKNPQHAFLRRVSKAVCPMSQICGM